MNRSISDYISRWRHTLGHGVHSPLAYRIVKECLHPDNRYAMYADDYINSVYGAADRTARLRAYLLVRLVNTLLPRSIWMPGADRRTADAIRKSFPSILISRSATCPKNADFIALFDNTDVNSSWRKLADTECVCLISFVGDQTISDTEKAPTLTMTGSRYSLFIRRSDMAPVAYGIL